MSGVPNEDFNTIQFEKRLVTLKDSQDVINACCRWCLDNRQHHKKIVNCWLNVLKRVKIEQRLNLFYLANDVIQYSKRKNYDFVESWGTALQKATTLVRDDKVKHKIVRIFTIWQQRGVYNEEFISDLCGLISVVPSASKSDEPHEFQAHYLINKIKQCARLENDTDVKLKGLKEHNPKISLEADSLCVSLKDRAHVDDVEKELDVYVTHLEGYINALKAEIKCRITNISVLKQANTQLEKDKKDVKLVANAYRVFGNKVKAFQTKLEDHKDGLTSPMPSPDINAPSPSPDCDIELPDDNEKNKTHGTVDYGDPKNFSVGYYNPVPVPPPPPVSTTANFITNGMSFMNSTYSHNMPNVNHHFTNATLNNSTSVTNSNYPIVNNLGTIEQPPPPPADVQFTSGHLPLLPPPMPPAFSENNYNQSYGENAVAAYPLASDEYNPEHELDTWENESWTRPPLDTDTPESPPLFEREGYVEGIEYHDNMRATGVADVDHRVLTPLSSDIESRGRKDVDHRNLISLTGSPADNTSSSHNWSAQQPAVDQDYRNTMQPPPPQPPPQPPQQMAVDQDYRLAPFNIDQLKLPPPPPPPAAPTVKQSRKHQPPRKPPQQDNVESIDMELSEEDENMMQAPMMKPPPPFPDLPDDADANSFLDDLDNDLNSSDFTANLPNPEPVKTHHQHHMHHNFQMAPPPPPPSHMAMPPPPPPLMGFPAPPMPPPDNHWMKPRPPMMQQQQQQPQPPHNFYANNRGGPPMRMMRGRGRGRGHFGGHNNFNRGFGRGGRGHKRGGAAYQNRP